MAKYKLFFLATGIKYINLKTEIEILESYEQPTESQLNNLKKKKEILRMIESERKQDELMMLELEEQLDELSSKGWELVQIPESLMNCESVCGYALFRKD